MAHNPMVGGAPMYANKTIVENAVNSKDHTTLVAAVKAAGLVDTLSGAGPFTVFAPTNAAVEEFLTSQNYTLSDLLDSELLPAIVGYHLVPAVIPVADMAAGEELPTFFIGQNLTLTAPASSDSAFTVDGAESSADIVQADIPAGQVSWHTNDAVFNT